MKKFLPILLLAFVSLFIYSCDNRDNNNFVDSDTVPVMTDATGTFTSSEGFTLSLNINIKNTDVVLVYRRVGNVWQSIPKTYYLDDMPNYPADRQLDYNFDFNTQEVNISTAANFNQSTQMSPSETNQYLRNQTFRVVLVPANSARGTAAKGTTPKVDTSDYKAVVKYYNLDESQVKTYKIN